MSLFSWCILVVFAVTLWCALLQHEKYSSQLQMSLKASEVKKNEEEEQPRGDKTQRQNLTQGTLNTPGDL